MGRVDDLMKVSSAEALSVFALKLRSGRIARCRFKGRRLSRVSWWSAQDAVDAEFGRVDASAEALSLFALKLWSGRIARCRFRGRGLSRVSWWSAQGGIASERSEVPGRAMEEIKYVGACSVFAGWSIAKGLWGLWLRDGGGGEKLNRQATLEAPPVARDASVGSWLLGITYACVCVLCSLGAYACEF